MEGPAIIRMENQVTAAAVRLARLAPKIEGDA